MKKVLLFTVFILVVALAFSVFACADVGNIDFDIDDFGGGDSGFDGGGMFALLWLLGDLPFGAVFIIIIVFVIIIFSRAAKNAKSAGPKVQHVVTRDYTAVDDATAMRVREKDPGFSPEEFKSYAKDVLLRTQESWEARNMNLMRPYLTPAYFNVIRTQAQEYIDDRKTNHIDGQNISDVWLVGFSQNEKNDVLTVRITCALTDYVTSDETGAVIGGYPNERQTRVYKLEFVRTAGMKTHTHAQQTSYTCPNCGAALPETGTGKCDYCGSIVITGEHDWMLNNYALWKD